MKILGQSNLTMSGISQCAYVVPSIRDAATSWIRSLGAGPFFFSDGFEVRRVRPNGEKLHSIINVAVGHCGDVQIELIERVGGTSSFFDMDLSKGPAHHHLGMFTDNMDEALRNFEREGSECFYKSKFQGATVAFVDTRPTLGFFSEIFERGDVFDAFFARTRDAAIDWDGSEPLRPL